MFDKKEILKKRLTKISSHYESLKAYYNLIESMQQSCNFFKPDAFAEMKIEDKAILDAYLKRFASLQDFLGAKIFPLLIEISGIGTTKMSEVLFHIEKEGIIDDLSHWIELREARNELEHDYPDDIQKALDDLKFCINSFYIIENYYLNSVDFAKKYL